MTPFLLSLSFILGYLTIWMPIQNARRERIRQEFEDSYKAFQAYYVREYYEAVQNESLRELRNNYKYEDAYNGLTIKH